MTLEAVLILGAALMGVGLYGALSQMAIVMIMMGLELVVNGAIVTIVGFWFFLSPTQPDAQIYAIIALTVMAIEALMGYGVLFAMFRCERGLVDEAQDLRR